MKMTIRYIWIVLAMFAFEQGRGQSFVGVTRIGGDAGAGTIFNFANDGTIAEQKFSFQIEANPGRNADYAQLIEVSGQLYGVMAEGGLNDHGVLFRVHPVSLIYEKLADFDWSTTGARPFGGLVHDNGVLYGVTTQGGANGDGAVFSYTINTQVLSKLADFDNNTTGKSPFCKLVKANNGNFYGVTPQGGGLTAHGTIFEFNPNTLQLSVKFAFTNDVDGSVPLREMVLASDGKLVGMTYGGGVNGIGTIFEFDPATGSHLKRIDFESTSVGGSPIGSLLLASDGNFYGTTTAGGANGLGSIFRYTRTILNVIVPIFSYSSTVNEGAKPGPSMVQNSADGWIYGTTEAGGVNDAGIIFSFEPTSGTFFKEYDLDWNYSGAAPKTGLTLASNGSLYGLTAGGGPTADGTLFSYTSSSFLFQKLLDMNLATGGSYPMSGVVKATDGKYYGVTNKGGTNGWGVIYQYDQSTGAVNVMKHFNDWGVLGAAPVGAMILGINGKLYGTTTVGGLYGGGTIFEYDPQLNVLAKKVDLEYNSTGSNAVGALSKGPDGTLYGVAQYGGANGGGTLFSYVPGTSTASKVHDFSALVTGSQPMSPLTLAPDGYLYGTTQYGGAEGKGVFYVFDPVALTVDKKFDFGAIMGALPTSSATLAPNGKLYGTTPEAGASGNGTVYEFDYSANTVTKVSDFEFFATGAYAKGQMSVSPNGKLYGLSASGGADGRGRIYQFDPDQNSLTSSFAFSGQGGMEPLFVMPALDVATEPELPATGLTFYAITQTGFKYDFAHTAGSYTGYIHLRKEGSPPTFIPVDGLEYTTGTVLPDGSVVQFSDEFVTGNESTGLNAGTDYYYAIFVYNGSGTDRNYLNAQPLTGQVTTPGAPEPTASPTGLNFYNITGTSFSYEFVDANPVPDGYIHIRRAGDVPGDVPVDGVEYVAPQALGSSLVAFVGPGTAFDQSSVTSGISYHYAIYAYNGSGADINYRLVSPATGSVIPTDLAAEPTSQPTGLSFSNVSTTSYSLSFVAASGSPSGYVGIVSTGTPDQPVDGVMYTAGDAIGSSGSTVIFFGTSTAYDVTGADPDTQFNYAIYAFNGTGTAINYRQLSPLTASVTTLSDQDSSPPILQSNSTYSQVAPTETLTVKASWSDPESGITNVYISYGPTNQKDWAAIDVPMTNTSGNSYQITIPITAIGKLGVEYRMTAYNGSGLYTESDLFRTVVEYKNDGLSIPYSSFGSEVSSYRIISIPLVLDNKTINGIFSDDLGAYDPKNWRMWRYQSGNYSELTGSSQTDLGRGYMFIAKKGTSSTLDTGSGVTANFGFGQPFTFTPSNGWNLIGNPFNFDVTWADVQAENADIASVKLKTFNGGPSFLENNTLQAFGGGFIFVNTANPITIPHVKSGRTVNRAIPQSESLDAPNWWVDLKVKALDAEVVGGFGMSEQASDDFDSYDDFTLPRFLDYLEINHQKTLHGSSYAKDVVPVAANHQWDFTVDSSLPSDITFLEWDNSYFGINGNQLVLWDIAQQRAINMRESTGYSFKSTESRAFQVFFGSPVYIAEKTKPNKALIHEVFPIPAEREVTFQFSVPESAGSTKLEVFDLTGRKVATLVDGPLKAGYHEVTWVIDQGQKPRAGIYVSALQTGGAVAQKKLILK